MIPLATINYIKKNLQYLNCLCLILSMQTLHVIFLVSTNTNKNKTLLKDALNTAIESIKHNHFPSSVIWKYFVQIKRSLLLHLYYVEEATIVRQLSACYYYQHVHTEKYWVVLSVCTLNKSILVCRLKKSIDYYLKNSESIKHTCIAPNSIHRIISFILRIIL